MTSIDRGTPINQLRGDQNTSDVVNNILTEMEHQDQPPMAPPSQQRYAPQEEQYEEQYYEDEQEQSAPVVKQLSFSEKLLSEAKLPVLVVLLVFVANFSQLNKLLVEYVPKVVGNDGNINMLGLLVKAVLAGVLFYVVKKFVL